MGGKRGVNGVVGLVLVVLGVLLLLEELFGARVGRFTWPFFVIIPGLLFFFGMALGGKSAGGLAIPGSIITMTGLILLFQNSFGHWQSWAYAWALVAPTAVGVGLMIQGVWSDQPTVHRIGRQLAGWGIVIFLIGAAFFELVLDFSGLGRGPIARILWPSLLIALGVYLLLRRPIGSLFPRGGSSASRNSSSEESSGGQLQGGR